MTPEQLLERLAAVRIDRSHGARAPHKPLMLLLALGRVGLGPEGRLIPYQPADRRFKKLWEEFGRPGARPRSEYPFGRLRNVDRLWEIPEESLLSTGRAEELRVGEARRLGITGGFRQDVHDLLSRNPGLVSRAARQILAQHFPSSIHRDVLDAVRTVWRCAVCIIGRWTGGRWGWRRSGAGSGFWCPGRCGGGVRPPASAADAPDRRFVEWHRVEVFRG